MTNLSSKILSLVLPIVVSLLVVLVFLIFRKPLLTEILFSLIALSVAYFLFVFVCLIFNIGIRKEKLFDFAEIPGLTKHHGWFNSVASSDGSSGANFDFGADDPLGCLVGALIAIFLPLLTAIVIFLLSGGVEVLLFLAAYVLLLCRSST